MNRAFLGPQGGWSQGDGARGRETSSETLRRGGTEVAEGQQSQALDPMPPPSTGLCVAPGGSPVPSSPVLEVSTLVPKSHRQENRLKGQGACLKVTQLGTLAHTVHYLVSRNAHRGSSDRTWRSSPFLAQCPAVCPQGVRLMLDRLGGATAACCCSRRTPGRAAAELFQLQGL